MQTPKKIEYDRDYSAERYTEFRALKNQVSLELFGGRCFLCDNTNNYEEYHFHHLAYDPTDSSYARNSKALWTRILRVKEAQAHPERFRLLCPDCHRLVTTLGTHILKRHRLGRRKADLALLMALVEREVENRRNEHEQSGEPD